MSYTADRQLRKTAVEGVDTGNVDGTCYWNEPLNSSLISKLSLFFILFCI
jgi:hypothetical protein